MVVVFQRKAPDSSSPRISSALLSIICSHPHRIESSPCIYRPPLEVRPLFSAYFGKAPKKQYLAVGFRQRRGV